MAKYPKVTVNLTHLRHNTEVMLKKCRDNNIWVTGVIKGASGLVQVAKLFEDCGIDSIGSSRLEQLEDAKNAGVKTPLTLIRIPMLTEVEDTIRIADVSLNSELVVLEALNKEAGKQGKRHNVIIMADIGDLREGFWDKEEMIRIAQKVENEMDNLYLLGIGTNVGCYGSLLPTVDKLNELVAIAEKIEKVIKRRLEFISGGATSSYMRVIDGNLPKRINHLRLGEGILLATDFARFYHYRHTALYKDIFKLEAEVIEAKNKPSYPQGKMSVDAFGHKPTYEDKGLRKKVLLGIGKVDYGDPNDLEPKDEGVKVLGAASDHTILDVTDAKKEYKIGDILEFPVFYSMLVYLTSSRNVNVEFIE